MSKKPDPREPKPERAIMPARSKKLPPADKAAFFGLLNRAARSSGKPGGKTSAC